MRDEEPVLTVLQGTGGRAVVNDPARALRSATSVRAVLEELRGVDDGTDGVRERLASILTTVRSEVGEVLTPDLVEELEAMKLPDPSTAPVSDLRLGLAQLLGWLEGLFHGVSADLVGTQEDREPGGRSGHYL